MELIIFGNSLFAGFFTFLVAACVTWLAFLLSRAYRRWSAGLRESEDRYRLIVTNQTEFIVKWLPDGTRTFVNECYCRYFGVTEEACLGTSFLPLVAPEFREAIVQKIASITPDNPEATDEHLSYVAGGGQRWQEWTDRGSFGTDGRLIELLSTGRDITSRKETERRLAEVRRKKEELLAVLDTFQAEVPIGIAFVGRDYRFIRCNDALAEINGIPVAEHLGRTVADVVPSLWPQLEPLYQHVFAGKGPIVNQEIIGETAARPGQLRYWLGSYFPVRLHSEIIGMGIIVNEITERRQMEAQLRQTQKMNAVGQLAAGVAHDFNNILTVINVHSEILLAALPAEHPLHSGLNEIHNAGERAASLTQQLLAFSRQTILEPKLLDLGVIVREAQNMLRRLIGEDIELDIVINPEPCLVTADPGQLQQIVLNLALNARDAMPQGGRLTIATSHVELNGPGRILPSDLKPGRFVCLTMSDSGSGMTADVQARIFEPFYTTKGPGMGTGLGLSVVHGIIRQNGGFIEVQSEPGRGATFQVYLPFAEERRVTPTAGSIGEATAGQGTETILLVEDEDAVRMVSQAVLEAHGYTVLAAANAGEAVQTVEVHRGPIDMLLTDVVMPGMNGRQLAEVLRNRIPALKVLFMSGYTSDTILRHGILHRETDFVEKPFSPRSLAKKVRTVLDQPLPAGVADRVAGG